MKCDLAALPTCLLAWHSNRHKRIRSWSTWPTTTSSATSATSRARSWVCGSTGDGAGTGTADGTASQLVLCARMHVPGASRAPAVVHWQSICVARKQACASFSRSHAGIRLRCLVACAACNRRFQADIAFDGEELARRALDRCGRVRLFKVRLIQRPLQARRSHVHATLRCWHACIHACMCVQRVALRSRCCQDAARWHVALTVLLLLCRCCSSPRAPAACRRACHRHWTRPCAGTTHTLWMRC